MLTPRPTLFAFSVATTALALTNPASAALTDPLHPSQIICGSQFSPSGHGLGAGHADMGLLCRYTAHDFYEQEFIPHVYALLHPGEPGTAEDGFSSVTADTTFLIPGGTLVSPGTSLASYFGQIFASSAPEFLDISLDYTFKPIDLSTVIIHGAPIFTFIDHEHGGTVRQVRLSVEAVYRRSRRTPRGWELITEFFTYQSPFLDDLPLVCQDGITYNL
ncbi:hypothetical protein [Sorangium sp. So ce1335]|uniref:hypothetical protein n=1 Tax=Sorangium sp. So ce1335 TaxID=3133335 RepID=UPI003F62654A